MVNLIVVPSGRRLELAFNSVIKEALFRRCGRDAFIVGALIILWVERRKHVVRVKSVDDMTSRDALKIGIAQSFALIPGTSRSGATIIGGLLFGLSRRAATEFSFFLAVPTLICAGAYDAWKHRALFDVHDIGVFAVGMIAAFVSAFVCVRWLMRFIANARLHDLCVVSNPVRRNRAVDGVERYGQLDAVRLARWREVGGLHVVGAGALVVRRHEEVCEIASVQPMHDPDPSPLLGNLPGSLRHPVRIETPVARRGWLERGPGPTRDRGNDAFVAISWDEALDRAADELKRVVAQHGNRAIFGGSYGWASAGCSIRARASCIVS